MPVSPQPRHASPNLPRFRRIVGWCVTITCALLAVTANGGAQQRPTRDPSPHSDAQLVAGESSARPGSVVTLAVRLTLDDGWHTYWTNPGDAGLPLRVKWTNADAMNIGPLLFPTPRLAPQPPLMSFGYERELFVLTELQVPATAIIGSTITISGTAEWLACAEVCLPAKGTLSLSLPVRASAPGSTGWRAAIAATRSQLPSDGSAWRTQAWATSAGYIVTAIVPSPVAAQLRQPYFFIDSANVLDYAAPQRIARAGDTLVLSLPRAALATDSAKILGGIFGTDVAAIAPQSHRFTATVGAPPAAAEQKRAAALLAADSAWQSGGVSAVAAAVATATTVPSPSADMSVFVAMVFAFLGGLLLNLMPCVFPVLSIKVLSLLGHAGAASQAKGRKHGLAFGVGVLLSFWVLAGTLMALRTGGESLGWGFQLQSPTVVALLALLMFALGLNLSGVFEIGLSLTRLGDAGSGRGYGDSLLTGVLAVLVAAPCTAPFMGAALGFALVQPPIVGLLVFTALGVGLALPFAVLASAPQLLRFLPRPGPWLETLKQLFAFPLYATVVWLLWVFGQQAGIDALALVLLAMIALAMGAWLWARGVRSDRSPTRAIAAAIVLSAVALTTFGGVRAAPPAVRTPTQAGWEAFSENRLRELRTEGRPVFVDFTAAWCLSCQVNERVALRTDAVRQAFALGNVALLRADWTSRDSSITNVLASFGRSGVPLYVLYPAGGTRAADVLPAVLTPNMMVDAIRRAAPSTAALDRIR